MCKLKERLKEKDKYQTKPPIAAKMIRQLQAMEFRFEVVLADSLYGEGKVNMVAVPAVELQEIGNHYGLRTWIEYGLKQAKTAVFADMFSRVEQDTEGLGVAKALSAQDTQAV